MQTSVNFRVGEKLKNLGVFLSGFQISNFNWFRLHIKRRSHAHAHTHERTDTHSLFFKLWREESKTIKNSSSKFFTMAIVYLFLKLLESKIVCTETFNEDECMISQIEVWRKYGVPPNNQTLVTPMSVPHQSTEYSLVTCHSLPFVPETEGQYQDIAANHGVSVAAQSESCGVPVLKCSAEFF